MRALSAPARAETARPLAPLSLSNPSPVARSWLEQLEPLPHAVHQHHGFPGSETPSTYRSWWSACRWRSKQLSRQRPCPNFAALTERSTRVHAQSLCARPSAQSAIHRREPRHMPSVGFCNWRRSPNTLTRCTRPPPSTASCFRPSSTAPGGALPAELSQPRGCRAPTLFNTTAATARTMALPQPDLARTPLVASWCSVTPRKGLHRAAVR